jgi:heat shock protein HslJ
MADNSRNALNWNGIYVGVVPCADCEGIFTQITLSLDGTYRLQTEYLGREHSEETLTGTFEWDDAGGDITLSGLKEKSMPNKYKVGENRLIQLDLEGNVIKGDLESNYELNKVSESLFERKWELYELEGTHTKDSNSFITFSYTDNRVSGNSGCNNFTGTYHFAPNNKIKFSALASTQKMCIDMSVEDKINKLIGTVDSYTLQDDTLSFNNAQNVPVIKWVSKEISE